MKGGVLLGLFASLLVVSCGAPAGKSGPATAAGASSAPSARNAGKCTPGGADEPVAEAPAIPQRKWEPPPKRPPTGNAKLDQLRDDEDYVLSAMEVASDQEIDKAQAELLKVSRILAGQQGSKWIGASGKPVPTSGIIEELRKAGAVVKFKERKWARGTYSLDEKAFFDWYRTKDPDGTKLPAVRSAFLELRAQGDQIASMMRRFLQDQEQATLITVARTQFMLASRKKLGGKLDDKDMEHVRIALGQQKRVEALTAVALGLTATFQGAVADNKNPKAVDAIAEASAKGLPLEVSVSDAQAKQFVDELPAAIKDFKAKLEEWQSRAMGKEEYEREGRAKVQAFLKELDTADADQWAKVMADKRRQIVPNRVTAAPTRQQRRVAHRRDPGCDETVAAGGSPGAATRDGSAAPASPGDQGVRVDVTNTMQGIDAARKGDIATALDRAAKVSPSGTVKRALEGAAAVANGDVKGALGAAIDLVPVPGPIKDGLQLALSLFG